MNILLIEPDRLLAKTYSEAIGSAGHKVKVCANAQAAVRSADKMAPDLVVMELQLVGHSGWEFLYEFRSYTDWQKIPVIIHSLVPPGEFSTGLLMKKLLGISQYYYKPRTKLSNLLQSINLYATY